MKIIEKYFSGLTDNQLSAFSKLEPLYSEWNDKINVISRKDIGFLYERHILHSLAISKVIGFVAGTRILDVGTGGGFPGIPLAILFPESSFVLIDSIGKKIKVVSSIISELGLKNIECRQQHSNEVKTKFDFIVSRAVTAFPEFVKLSEGKIKKENKNALRNGILYLKGGELSEELKGFETKIKLYPISSFFTEPFFETKFVLHYPIEN
ncbi:MAG: 16S rRNA (guanine(527)-N(7))-methyltransferase RsmG [Bacteroidales bacterium]